MEGELVRWSYDSTPVNRQTRKQLERLDMQAQVRQADLQVRMREELSRVTAKTAVAQYEARQRIMGGYDLADQVVTRATHLNQKINQSSRDNPGLELTLRDVEYKAALAAGMIVYDYMAGK